MLSYGVVCVILRLAVLVELRLVTEGQTDGRTQSMASTADAQHRAVKTAIKFKYHHILPLLSHSVVKKYQHKMSNRPM